MINNVQYKSDVPQNMPSLTFERTCKYSTHVTGKTDVNCELKDY